MSDVPNPDFGDNEPEDAWHPDDSVPVMIDNLFARLALLDGDSIKASRRAMLSILQHRLAFYQARRGSLSERAKVRVDQLVQDLNYLRGLVQ